MYRTKGTKVIMTSSDGKEKKQFMSDFAYTMLLYSLYALSILVTQSFIFEHTTWADWVFEIRLMRSDAWVWILMGVLPLGIVYLDEKIERRRTVFGAVAAVLLPGVLLAFLYMEQINIRLAVTVGIICAIIALFLAAIVLPVNKDEPRRRKLSRRFYLLATLMKRVCCVVVSVAFIFLTVFGATKTEKAKIYAENVEPTNIIVGEKWSDKCEYYRNYLCKLNPEEWSGLSDEEKLEVLQCVVNLEAAYLGMSFSPNVNAEYIDGEGGALAHYNYNEKLISFDLDHLRDGSYQRCLLSAIHEVRHSYQYNVIDAYASLDDQYNEMFIYSETREWIDAINNYPDTSDGVSDDEMYDYSTNAIEVDAYIYAINNEGYYMAKSMRYCIEQGTAVSSECIDLGDSVRLICFPHHVYFSNDIMEESYMKVYGEFESEEGYGDINAVIDSIETGYFDSDDLMDIRFVLGEETITFTQSEYGYIDVTDISGSDMWCSQYVDWDENPIDSFYADYAPNESDDTAVYYFRYARAEAWKAELYNAYELLGSGAVKYVSGTDAAEIAAASNNAAESFIVYAEAVIEADKICQEPDADLQSWSVQYLGNLYRKEALRVYKLAADYYDIEDAAEVFVFDPDRFTDMLSSEYGVTLEKQIEG